VFQQILESLPLDDVHNLSRTSTAFYRTLDPIIEQQISKLDREQAAPLVKRLVFQSSSPSACSPMVRRICRSETLREQMFVFQKERIGYSQTFNPQDAGDDPWFLLHVAIMYLPCDDADYPAFFAAASGNAKLLKLLAKSGWMPFRGTLFFAVRWELGYPNPFIPPDTNEADNEKDEPIVSPVERVPGVVETVLATPMPPGIKHLMVIERLPAGFEPGINNQEDDLHVLWFPSIRPPDCTVAARILRQILPMARFTKDVSFAVTADPPDPCGTRARGVKDTPILPSEM
jgi:hypothetical protein